MTVQQLSNGVVSFINTEIVPKLDGKEKAAVIGATVLGIFNIEQSIHNMLNIPLLQTSTTLWADEAKTQINSEVFKEFLEKWVASVGGEYKYEGMEIDLGFNKFYLFSGFKVNQEFINSMFNHIGV